MISAALPTTVELEARARKMRRQILRISSERRTPHLGGAFSSVELLVGAYFSELRLDPARPDEPDRDRLIFSKGHAALALYVALAQRGIIADSMLNEYAREGGRLAEQPSPGTIPGVEWATGSLGHGLGVGLGMAHAAKLKRDSYRVFVIMSDGELGEGSIWEAALLAPALQLDNLTVLIDYNKLQATGRSNEILAIDPLVDKWRAFGWASIEIDGHDMGAVVDAYRGVPFEEGRPSAVIAHTVKGKGVSFMEDNILWHYRPPDGEELSAALAELAEQ